MTWYPGSSTYIPVVGEEWIYRLREHASSERVRIIAIKEGKRSTRVDVEFCDGDRAGTQENVPGTRLHGPWDTVAEYDERMANWQRISEFELTDAEQAAVEEVFLLLIPDEAASWTWNPVRFATAIHDPAALEKVTGVPTAELVDRVASFQREDVTMLSAEGTLLVAEHACRTTPMPVLDMVIEQEKEIREKCKNGRGSSRGGVDTSTTPEWEYEYYLKYQRPVHELLRQWCGHRAITMQERLAAAEAESRRLDVLVNRLIDALADKGDLHFARAMVEELESERITPEKIRPVVDRPLHPSEIPVRHEHRRRRWG